MLLDDFSAVFRTCQWQLLNGLRISSQIVFQILKGVLSKREMFHHSIIIVESIIRRSQIYIVGFHISPNIAKPCNDQ